MEMVFHDTNHKNNLMQRVQCLKNGQSLCSLCGQTSALSTGVLTLSYASVTWYCSGEGLCYGGRRISHVARVT